MQLSNTDGDEQRGVKKKLSRLCKRLDLACTRPQPPKAIVHSDTGNNFFLEGFVDRNGKNMAARLLAELNDSVEDIADT